MARFFLLLISCLFLLQSCATVGRKIDQTAADKIQKGVTTKEQVVTLMGAPDRLTRKSNGEMVFIYTYARATAKPASFIPVFGPLVGGANVQHQMFMVLFDANGIVKNFSSSQGATESGTGLAAGSKPDIPDVEQGKRAK